MRVIRAEEMGMCFGVRDALKIIHQIQRPEQVTIHGELVHNPVVNMDLKEAGFHQSDESSRVIPEGSEKVLVTAHGISNRERQRLISANKELIDTTCPLVMRAHAAAMKLQAEGRLVLVIGSPVHVEVRGIVEDLDEFRVVPRAEDVEDYGASSIGIMCQTTMPEEVVTSIRKEVSKKNPDADIRFIDSVCHPTKNRQSALLELVNQVEVVVVVGGHNSNNTRRLVEKCNEYSTPAFHVADAEELCAEWFVNVSTVGLTAGTSTLDETIDAVHVALQQINEGEYCRQAN